MNTPPLSYRERFYRDWQHPDDLVSHTVRHGETDLHVFTKAEVPPRTFRRKLDSLVLKYRAQLEETIENNSSFLHSLLPVDLRSPYPMIDAMVKKSREAGVGPMAGVAGAVAEFVGKGLLSLTDEIIVENGGDVFLKSGADRTVLLYAGEDSPFKDRLRIRLRGGGQPRGLATSSRTIGHSLSLGNTDATLIIADSAVTADVFATAVGNRVKRADDLQGAVEFALSFRSIKGGLILIGDRMAAFGEIELA
jgi:ApbE superfamily uncharacterized protein (UPF0280 family)